MTIHDKLATLSRYTQGYWQNRIYQEVRYALNMSEVEDHTYDALVEEAEDLLLAAIKRDGLITNANARKAEAVLMPLSAKAKELTVHWVGHAHIDMNWMWGYNETASVAVDTFRTMLDLMNEYPQFTFAQSQASVYKILEDFAPSMIKEIKKRVKEGRWEVTAGAWVENDKNMPNGESQARHILYTKKYLSKLLDVPEDYFVIDFEPDTFGHNITLPEILSEGGIKYYYNMRAYEGDHIVNWDSRNGNKRILVYREPYSYNAGDVTAHEMHEVPFFCKQNGIKSMLRLYGCGDHGGGPSRRMIEHILDLQKWPIQPTVLFSTYHRFFAELEAVRDIFPTVRGEENFIFTGCYTSESRIKMANRLAETRTEESEAISAAAQAYGFEKFVGSFEESWHNILFNHFHDIITGSGVIETREYAMGMFQRSMACIDTNANRSMRYLASLIDTSSVEVEEVKESHSEGGGTGFMVGAPTHYALPQTERGLGKKRIYHLFNTTQYDFDGVTCINIYDWPYDRHRIVFRDVDGAEAPFKCVNGGSHYWGHDVMQFQVRVKVPAMGYATYVVDEKGVQGGMRDMRSYDRRDQYSDADIVVENNLIRVTFDHMTMEMKSFVDKATGKEMLDKPAGIFRFIDENDVHGMSAWRVGERMNVENINETRPIKVSAIDLGGVYQQIRFEMPFASRSKMNVTVIIRENSPVVEYEAAVDFHEIGTQGKGQPQLNFFVPVGYKTDTFRYDVPFGTIDRKPIAYDVPGNSFVVPIPESGSALMLTTDTKYGYRGWDNAVSVDLIRGSYSPDPYPEYGVHHIRIGVGIVPSIKEDDLFRVNEAFQHAALPVCSARRRKGTLPMRAQFFKTEGKVHVSCLKTPEYEEGVVVRLSDQEGLGSAFKLTFAKPVAKAQLVDLTERKVVGALTVKGKEVSGKVAPFEVNTVLVQFK